MSGAPPSADDLLAAPRGRRLCLEIAIAASTELWSLVLDAERAFHADDGSVVRLWSGAGDAGPMPAAAEPAAVSQAIDGIAVSALDGLLADGAAVLACFGATVDSAMYWQPPAARDVLIALPELRRSLRRVAGRLAASGLLAEWSAPADSAGWRVEFEVEASDARWPGDPDAVLAAWTDGVLAEESRMRDEIRRNPDARWSGTWWSCPTNLSETGDAVAGTPCGLALVEDELGWTRALVTSARGVGRVLELDEAAWIELCRRHPLDVSASRQGDWGRTTGRTGAWVLPDWHAVAAEWDAVHLSIAQYLVLAGRALPVDSERASVVAGWGPGITRWLHGRVRLTGEPARWTRENAGSAGEPWALSAPPQG